MEVYFLAKELENLLKNARISNFYFNEELNLALIKLHSTFGTRRLIYQGGLRAHLTSFMYPFSSPSTSVINVRKIIKGAFIREITQENFDRILKIEIEKGNEKFSIFLELMSGGALVVTDKEGKIIFTTEKKKMKDRSLAVGIKYSLPPSKFQSPFYFDINSLNEKEENLSKFLSATLGLGNLAQAAMNYLRIEDKKLKELSEEEILSMKRLPMFIDQITPMPTVYIKANTVVDFSLIPLNYIQTDQTITFSSISEALDKYFTPSGEIYIESKKISKSREEERVRRLLEMSREAREKANLIMSNLQAFEIVLAQRKDYPPIKVNKINYDKRLLEVKINNFTIELDYSISAAKNASKLFELSKELEEKAKAIKPKKVEKKETRIKLKEEKEKVWYKKFRYAFTSTNKMILLGKDAITNEILLKKYAVEDDLVVFHSDFPGSPFAVVWPKQELKEEEMEEVASLVASYTSKAWESGFSALDVFCVERHQLSKKAPSGTFLSKGSFVVSGEKKFFKSCPLKILISFNEKGEPNTYSFMSESKLSNYFVIVPGNVENKTIARKILDIASKKFNLPEDTINEITSKLPDRKSELAYYHID
ncbi:MAG: NFACT family protein [Candidatus Brockarchaeota archaeon]|nr:NFACT family protein [Candidatus Brockarchaeota archaeon]